jgi:large subunit ribosomal protein L9e
MVPVLTFVIAIALRVESLDMKSKAGSAKVTGTLMSLGGVLLLSLYKGVAVTTHNGRGQGQGTSSSSPQVGAAAAAVGGSGVDKKSWMLGTVSLLANGLFFSFWLLLQSRLTRKYPALYSSTATMFFISTLQAAALTVAMERHSRSVWIVTRRLEILTILYSVSSIYLHSCLLACLGMNILYSVSSIYSTACLIRHEQDSISYYH